MEVLYPPMEESSGGQAPVSARNAAAPRGSPLVNETYHGLLIHVKG